MTQKTEIQDRIWAAFCDHWRSSLHTRTHGAINSINIAFLMKFNAQNQRDSKRYLDPRVDSDLVAFVLSDNILEKIQTIKFPIKCSLILCLNYVKPTE